MKDKEFLAQIDEMIEQLRQHVYRQSGGPVGGRHVNLEEIDPGDQRSLTLLTCLKHHG